MWKTAFICLLCCLVSLPVTSAPKSEPPHPALAGPDGALQAHLQGEPLLRSRGQKGSDAQVRPPLGINPDRLPIYFVGNEGQMDPRVKYYAKTGGCTVYFSDDGVYFSFVRSEEGAGGQRGHGPASLLRRRAVPRGGRVEREIIKLTALNASRRARIEAEGAQPTVFSYFMGKDPSRWHRNVPAYEAVVYKGLYPGIDVRFYYDISSRQVEYDVVAAPGADVSRVRFGYEGIRGLKLDESGNLLVQLQEGNLVQKKPRMYQSLGGKDIDRAGRFRIADGGKSRRKAFAYAFEVSAYDKSRPLIIDPQIAYSTYLGGSYSDMVFGIAVDASGAAYVVGTTDSLDFRATIGAFQGSGIFGSFVSKISPDGSRLVYSAFFAEAQCGGIAVNAAGEAYVACATQSTKFPMVNALQPKSAGGYDAVIAKLNSQGSGLVFSTYLGGSGDDGAGRIALDPSGDIFIAGSTGSLDFPIKNAFQPTYAGGLDDGFVTELTSDGSSLVYSTYLGGSSEGYDSPGAIAVDAGGSAYVVGRTNSNDFPITPGALDGVWVSPGQGFVTKIAPGGASLVYSTFLGGSSGGDAVGGVAVDGSGAAYLTGGTWSMDFPLVNPIQPLKGGGDNATADAFVSKLSPDGSSLVYSTYLGGSDTDGGSGIAVDASGAAYVTGAEWSSDFPTVDPLPVDCSLDAFVTKVNPEGTAWVYSTCLGGNWYDETLALAVDSAGAVYVGGNTISPDFPVLNAIEPYAKGETRDTGSLEDYKGFLTKLQCDSINSPQVLEGAGNAIFEVHLCSPNTLDGSVDYQTADGTATAGSDYIATSGTLTIPAGSISGQIVVPLIDDAAFEPNETFFLNLSNPVNLNLTTSQASAVILDDDSLLIDDFDNGVVGWTWEKGEWHEGGGILQGIGKGAAELYAHVPWFPSGAPGCGICTIETSIQTAGGPHNKVFLESWFTDNQNKVELIMKQETGKWVLRQRSGGVIVAKAGSKYPIQPDVGYHIRLSFDGNNFNFSIEGTPVLTLKAGAPPSGNVGLKVKKTTGTFGPIRVY